MTARPAIDEHLLDEAETWHSSLELADADWDGYTTWLEADPRHREAFDAVVLTHRIVDERVGNLEKPVPLEEPEEPSTRGRPRRWFYVYGAAAAAVALALAVPAIWLRSTDTVYATRPGETRQIALATGINVDLAPASRLILADGSAKDLELSRGEAIFTVVHDPARKLSIKAGEYVVGDIGTTFAVNVSAETVKVGVAEGRLTVMPNGGEAASVAAGQQLIASRTGGAMQLTSVASADVGSWRKGRLVYSDTPLAVVAADISRYTGKTIAIDPAIGSQSFSGVLAIGDGSKLLSSLADLTGLTYQEEGNSARLGASPSR